MNNIILNQEISFQVDKTKFHIRSQNTRAGKKLILKCKNITEEIFISSKKIVFKRHKKNNLLFQFSLHKKSNNNYGSILKLGKSRTRLSGKFTDINSQLKRLIKTTSVSTSIFDKNTSKSIKAASRFIRKNISQSFNSIFDSRASDKEFACKLACALKDLVFINLIFCLICTGKL